MGLFGGSKRRQSVNEVSDEIIGGLNNEKDLYNNQYSQNKNLIDGIKAYTPNADSENYLKVIKEMSQGGLTQDALLQGQHNTFLGKQQEQLQQPQLMHNASNTSGGFNNTGSEDAHLSEMSGMLANLRADSDRDRMQLLQKSADWRQLFAGRTQQQMMAKQQAQLENNYNIQARLAEITSKKTQANMQRRQGIADATQLSRDQFLSLAKDAQDSVKDAIKAMAGGG